MLAAELTSVGVTLAPTARMIVGLLALSLVAGVGSDPYHNQGPLIFLVKDIHKPVASRMEWPDRVLQVSSSLMIFGDWLTTIDGRRKGYPESNPILGTYPSLGRVNLLIGSGLLANAFLVPKLKDKELRRGIWLAMMLVETKALHGNHAAGLKMNFRF